MCFLSNWDSLHTGSFFDSLLASSSILVVQHRVVLEVASMTHDRLGAGPPHTTGY